MSNQETIGYERAGRGLWIRRGLVFVAPVLVIFLAVAGVMAMGALKPEPEEKEDVVKAIPVLTEIAVLEDVNLTVTAQGEVQPRTKINIVPQVSGKISYMSPKFIEGGHFTKGDLLIRIEPDEYRLRVVQADAMVAQAQTVLTREQSESQIALKDWEELGEGGKPSSLTLREPQMAEAAARLASAKAQLGEANLQLRRTAIYAPFTGRVTSRAVNQGEFVTTGTRLGQVYAADIMDVRLPLSNEDLARAGLSLGFATGPGTPGLPVTLSANVAGIPATWTGEIVRTDSGFDPKTRVLFAYVEVKDPFGKGASNGTPLAPGIFVTADIAGQVLDNMVVIPRAALRGKDKVYVARDDDTLSILTVDVASSNRETAILTGGLEPGVHVVTSPIRGVADGMTINRVERSSGTAPQTGNGE